MESNEQLNTLEFKKPSKMRSILSKFGLGSPAVGIWRPVNPVVVGKHVIKGLKIATLNVWFDAMISSHRWQQSLDNLEKLNPDIICFQETTKKFLIQTSEQNWVRTGYYCSDIDGSTFIDKCWYGCALLVRKSIGFPTIRNLKFNESKMGRGLLFAEIGFYHANGDLVSINIGTSHLESRQEDWPQRQVQLQTISQNLPCNSVFCGDLNIYDDLLESQFIESLGWRDSFRELGIDGLGETWGKWNLTKGHDGSCRRLDRVIIKSGRLKPIRYETFGQDALAGLDVLVYPSDHLGVCVDFELHF